MRLLAKDAPAPYPALLGSYWPRLLLGVESWLASSDEAPSRAELLRRVRPTDLDRVLALPLVVQKYNDANSDDANSGYWRRGRLHAFALENDDHTAYIDLFEERPQAARDLCPDDLDEPHVRGYRYGLVETDGNRSVVLMYTPHSSTTCYEVPAWDETHYARALAWWHRFEHFVPDDNAAFLCGEDLEDD